MDINAYTDFVSRCDGCGASVADGFCPSCAVKAEQEEAQNQPPSADGISFRFDRVSVGGELSVLYTPDRTLLRQLGVRFVRHAG